MYEESLASSEINRATVCRFESEPVSPKRHSRRRTMRCIRRWALSAATSMLG